jgi:hypothetical protein
VTSFATAFEMLRDGVPVTRAEWVRVWEATRDPDDPTRGGPPKLVLIPGSTFTVETGRPLGDGCPELVGEQVDYHAHIDLKIGNRVRVWEPTQVDLFATDWAVHVLPDDETDDRAGNQPAG